MQTRVNAASIAAQLQHVQADPTGVVAGIAIVGALIGVGKMWWDASSSPSVAAEPLAFQELSQAEIALFFADLTDAVKELFVSGLQRDSAVISMRIESDVVLFLVGVARNDCRSSIRRSAST